MVLAASCFLARSTDSDNVDRIALHLKASRQPLQRGEDAEVFFLDVGNGLAMGADHVVVRVAVQLDPQ